MHDDAIAHMRAALESLGLSAELDAELARTPERFVELLGEYSESMRLDPPQLSTFDINHPESEPVVMCGLRFESLCVHHLLPFFGTIDVAYLPKSRLVGFGSIGRAIEYVAKRPQMQERLIEQLAELLEDAIQPRGLLLRLRARQLCMEMRGARKQGMLISYASRGELRHGPLRAQLLASFAQQRGAAS